MPIPASVFIHFITTVYNAPHLRRTAFKKIAFDQDSISLNQSLQFHIILVEFSSYYYLAYVQEKFVSSASLSLSLDTLNRCPPVDKLLNSTLMSRSVLGRMKYYHMPCREHQNLKCFYDKERMCLCTNKRHANCFEFEHNMTYDCQGAIYCQNGAQCFQDHPTCPSAMMCVCDECFYGSRCQFSTKGFRLSLDVILGYQIRPRIALKRQTTAVQVSLIVTMIMFVLGLINSTFSIITFQSAKSQEVGCGLYLLVSSIISTFITIIFTLKFWLVVLAQKGTLTNRSFISFSCITIDFLLQVLLSSNAWLNAAVIVERAVTVVKGATFDKSKAKRFAKVVIIILLGLIILTNLHDPLHRSLIDDIEEQRTWCIVTYSARIQLFDSIMNIFYFLTPFVLNFSSAVIIIITITRTRSKARRQTNYTAQLREQFREHRHLLISPVILIILALPRLIISFITGCMKSARNPWIFLFSYFISSIPSQLTFVVFVLSSDMYKKEFVKAIRQKYMATKRLLNIQ
jgi:hypothetical protein